MGRGPIPMRRPKLPFRLAITARSTFGISPSFLGLSQSSGQVTHVLLTRSRLCPRPKPGSSLHLHVLGTPPAFVLSQDQTLREELGRSADADLLCEKWQSHLSGPTTREPPVLSFQRVSRSKARHSWRAGPPKHGGWTRACPLVGQTLAPSRGGSMYTESLGAQDGVTS
jgi:hypothetical protein